MELKPIGIIHSPYSERAEAPFQGRMKNDKFTIEIFPQYEAGLKDIEEASHLIVLYWLDRAERDRLVVRTPWEEEPHGVFATRSPARPNPIAFDVVDLVTREGNKLIVRGMDALDGTKVIDIKPYSARTDSIPHARLGWFERALARRENNP